MSARGVAPQQPCFEGCAYLYSGSVHLLCWVEQGQVFPACALHPGPGTPLTRFVHCGRASHSGNFFCPSAQHIALKEADSYIRSKQGDRGRLVDTTVTNPDLYMRVLQRWRPDMARWRCGGRLIGLRHGYMDGHQCPHCKVPTLLHRLNHCLLRTVVQSRTLVPEPGRCRQHSGAPSSDLFFLPDMAVGAWQMWVHLVEKLCGGGTRLW